LLRFEFQVKTVFKEC